MLTQTRKHQLQFHLGSKMDTLDEISDRLMRLARFAELMIIFQEMYPKEFKQCALVSISDESAQTEALQEFIECLNNRFPLYADACMLFEWVDEGGEFYLPVYPNGIDSELDTSDQKLIFRVISAVTVNDYRDRLLTPLVGPVLGKYPDSNEVARVCEGKPRPLCWLADAYNWMTHETGNFWLDVSGEDLEMAGEPIDFTRENIAWLTEEWKDAQPIIKRCDKLNDWLKQDTLKRTRRVANLLREAAREQPRIQARVQVNALANVLNLEDDYEEN